MAAALEDPETAPIGEGLRAVLRFLRKLSLRPAEVTPADVEPSRTAGVSNDALADAVRVCAMFNAMDRCADALGFDPTTASPPEIFLTRGYAAMFKAAAPPS